MGLSAPASGIKPGTVAHFAASTAPAGWLKANGATVSRSTYAALFLAIGTTYGAGDGATTFNVPDLRGEFVRGLDDGRGVDSGRGIGTAQGDAIRNITGQSIAATHPTGASGGSPSGAFYVDGHAGVGSYDVSNRGEAFDASRVVPTASENRPRNVAMLACIKF